MLIQLAARPAAFDLRAMASSPRQTFPAVVVLESSLRGLAECTVVSATRTRLALSVKGDLYELSLPHGAPVGGLPHGVRAFLPFVPVVTVEGLCPRCHVSDLTLYGGGFKSMTDNRTRICPACHGDEVSAIRAGLPLSAPNHLQKTPHVPF